MDYRLARGAESPAPLAGVTLPRAFTAEQSGPALALRVPGENVACTDPSQSVLQSMHDAWLPLPDTLIIGREWTDTVKTLTCRDGLTLHGSAVRHFRVVRGEIAEGNRLVVLIDRIARNSVTGEGEQFGERVALRGDGSGTLRYVLDPLAGRLLRAEGSASLVLSFKSSRRNQQVRQETRTTISWLP